MADAILFNIAEAIISNLGSSALKEIGLLWGVKNDVRKLKTTMTAIEAVLLDAEQKQTHNHQVRNWLQNLQDVVYDADNLVDEFHTEALQRKVMPGNKMQKQVCIFFSSSNQFVFRLKMSQKIKEIREALDEIIENKTFLTLDVHSEETQLVRTIARETHSYVSEKEVIGRDDDKKAILKHLMDDETKENVSTIAIVGIGGLGKTTLAQLVYNNDKVQKHFDLRLWVCVSDVFDLKLIVGKIIKAACDMSIDQNLELDQFQSRLRREINGKKYFLVLDDVWNEDSTKWDSLISLLMDGARGSKVLVTTRSEKVAKVTRPFLRYGLEGLDEDKSWSLFEKKAFGPGKDFEKSDVMAIGKEIVKKCKGVPLAIKSIGSILYFKNSKSEWLLFNDNELAKAIQQEDNIIPTLELSYNHLPSNLKHCFAYCSLFPKDYEIDVQRLIWLWMAQGFIKSDQNQCPEVIGYGYFLDLLWRSFFQEVKKDKYGNISSCKLHDLMHDLAISVADTRSALINNDSSVHSPEKLVHVSFDPSLGNMEYLKGLMPLLKEENKFRTFVSIPHPHLTYEGSEADSILVTSCNKIFSKFKVLRALDLQIFGLLIKKLPNSLGELKHLRYLDISNFRELQELPNSITKLLNLQTLVLRRCSNLQSLPRDMHKLVNLRHLQMNGCPKLSHMPRRFGELTCLHTLDVFVVANVDTRNLRMNSSSIGGLGELCNLNNLRGELVIRNLRADEEVGSESKTPILQEKEHLQGLKLRYLVLSKEDHDHAQDQFVEKYYKSLDCLQPHPNLKSLQVTRYMGVKFARWVMSLVNLVKLDISYCENCQYLPPLNQLPCLQRLYLIQLPKLEYIMDRDSCDNKKESPTTAKFFPSLKKLYIQHCPQLTSMPLFPYLKSIKLYNTSFKPLEQTMTNYGIEAALPSSSSSASLPTISPLSKLKNMAISDIAELQYLPEDMGNLLSLQHLSIANCPNLTSLPEAMCNLSSLETLSIVACPHLTCLPDAMCNLSSLETLYIVECPHLTCLPEDMGNLSSLEFLRIWSCPHLTSLPEGMGYLSSLLSLHIQKCPGLTSLPDSTCNLSSLQSLHTIECPNLTSLPEGMGNLSSLQSLIIQKCPGLTSLPDSMCNLSSLQYIHIEECPSLTSLPEAMYKLSSLRSLHIQDCSNLASLPEAIGSLSSLQSLHIKKCSNFTSLPEAMGNLSSLKYLEILNCPNLISLPEGMQGLETFIQL